MKPDKLEQAKVLFKGTEVGVNTEGSKDTGIEVSAQGTRHLVAVGTEAFKRFYVSNKVKLWVETVRKLSKIAETEPHAAFTAYTHALQSQWIFISRVMPNISELFQPLEDAIRMVLLKTLLKKDPNDVERKMIGLPARLGGLGMANSVEASHLSY